MPGICVYVQEHDERMINDIGKKRGVKQTEIEDEGRKNVLTRNNKFRKGRGQKENVRKTLIPPAQYLFIASIPVASGRDKSRHRYRLEGTQGGLEDRLVDGECFVVVHRRRHQFQHHQHLH